MISGARPSHFYLLSFISGSVNAAAFLACQRFVTHATGFATLVGTDLALGQWTATLSMLTVPLFFIAGAAVSGLLIERRTLLGQHALYRLVLSLMTLCLLMAAIGGYRDRFGAFGDPQATHDAFFFLALLCFASGLQNALSTHVSQGQFRTTHVTGALTDIGSSLARGISARTALSPEQQRANHRRMANIAAFVTGASVGSLLCVHAAYLGLLLPAALSALCAWRLPHRWNSPIQSRGGRLS